MPINDLNLEFEDEEELRAKKSEAMHVDLDLEFQTDAPITPIHRPTAVPAQPSSQPKVQTQPQAQAVVRPIQSARSASPSPAARAFPSTPPQVAGATALKIEPMSDFEAQELIDLREKMRQVEINAEVKVQIAEFKTEYLTEMLSDMKLMEHQIGQLLVRINAKHPDLKNEALMIKKILADYTSKKRK